MTLLRKSDCLFICKILDNLFQIFFLFSILYICIKGGFWLLIPHEPVGKKTHNLGYGPGQTQTGLYNLRSRLEPWNFGFDLKRRGIACSMEPKQRRWSAVQLLHGWSAALFSHMQIVGFLMRWLTLKIECSISVYIINLQPCFFFQDEIRYNIKGEVAQRAFASGASNYFQIEDEFGLLILSQSVKNTDILAFIVSTHVTWRLGKQ